MTLNTMEPNPTWGTEAHSDVVEAFSELGDDAVVRVWGADWCGDCRSQLPDFAAALEAADVENVETYPVEREDREASETPQADGDSAERRSADRSSGRSPREEAVDGGKVGPLVEEYDVTLIPTIIVERDGEELARFVEEERFGPARHVADQLSD
jgi:thiol-disulfide isomerase/thioredoxin